MNERNTHNYDSESNSSGWIVGTLTGSMHSSRYFAHYESLDIYSNSFRRNTIGTVITDLSKFIEDDLLSLELFC